MSDFILDSGVSNYADTNRQDGESKRVPESGQVPKYYYGISSAHPSPETGGEDIIQTKPNREPIPSGENVFSYSNLVNNLSGPKNLPVEDLNYLNDYIHYYPKAIEVQTLYSRTIQFVPVRITALNFIRTDYSADPRYNYQPPENEEQ